MIELRLGAPAGQRLQILCLGAHSDDIEIGCGGTILTLLRDHPEAEVHWVVFSSSGSETRAEEARRSARLFLGDAAAQVVVHHFRDGFLPYVGGQVKDVFEKLKREVAPDLIFTHHDADRHQDHRLVCELTWNTFRDHLIVEYEIPKYDGDLIPTNLYVPIEESERRAKLGHLMESFASQRDKLWFSEATFDALMRLRGIECASPTGYAEGFHLRKATFV